MTKIIIPPKITKGHTIRIIAPSCSGQTILKPKLKAAEAFIKNLGFKVSFSKNLFEINKLQSSSVKSRISDLHEAFQDKSVKGIMAIRGGYNCNDLLDYIDWKIVKNNPKMYCGFSDNTVLQNAIFQKTGLITFSGPNFSTFGNPKQIKFTSNNFLRQVSDFPIPNTFQSLKNFSPITVINPGKASGRILGGNLCTFNLLQGTQYRPSIKGAIMFVEDDFISNYDWWEFCRNLQSLINLPDFKFVKGLVIGKFQPESRLPMKKIQEIIKTKPELAKIPVIANLNFGHTLPMFTFPVGGKANIDTAKPQPLSISVI